MESKIIESICNKYHINFYLIKYALQKEFPKKKFERESGIELIDSEIYFLHKYFTFEKLLRNLISSSNSLSKNSIKNFKIDFNFEIDELLYLKNLYYDCYLLTINIETIYNKRDQYYSLESDERFAIIQYKVNKITEIHEFIVEGREFEKQKAIERRLDRNIEGDENNTLYWNLD